MYHNQYGLPTFTEDDATLITPSMAEELIRNHRCMKSVNGKDLKLLINEMKSGNFEYNGASIVLDSEGRLID